MGALASASGLDRPGTRFVIGGLRRRDSDRTAYADTHPRVPSDERIRQTAKGATPCQARSAWGHCPTRVSPSAASGSRGDRDPLRHALQQLPSQRRPATGSSRRTKRPSTPRRSQRIDAAADSASVGGQELTNLFRTFVLRRSGKERWSGAMASIESLLYIDEVVIGREPPSPESRMTEW